MAFFSTVNNVTKSDQVHSCLSRLAKSIGLKTSRLTSLCGLLSMVRKAENRMPNESMAPSPDLISFREASVSDVELMEQSRSLHGSVRADERMAAYFRGLHHPEKALLPRTGYIAMADNKPVGYTAGHQTTRFGYAG